MYKYSERRYILILIEIELFKRLIILSETTVLYYVLNMYLYISEKVEIYCTL